MMNSDQVIGRATNLEKYHGADFDGETTFM